MPLDADNEGRGGVAKPTAWHRLLIFALFFTMLVLLVMLLPSARSNASTVGIWYTLRLIAFISSVVATILWIQWYIKWRGSRS